MRKKDKVVFGFGVNDADYPVYRTEITQGKKKITWRCPYYVKWLGMLTRCYSKKLHARYPSYAECEVCLDWKYFSSFKAWMEKQDWEDKELDKDILVFGNKIYSPETCIFIDAKTNSFVRDRAGKRGDYPIGVAFHKASGKFQAHCHSILTGKQIYLGIFDTAEEANKIWLSYKLEQANILAAEQSDPRISKALIERYTNYQ